MRTQAPGSGQQMFQQMFALLKQMLSPEQYATFYTEMRNGNGVSWICVFFVNGTTLRWQLTMCIRLVGSLQNDIKSIVDIIKRIAGDAMFSTLIQKLDLTRSFPSAAVRICMWYPSISCGFWSNWLLDLCSVGSIQQRSSEK